MGRRKLTGCELKMNKKIPWMQAVGGVGYRAIGAAFDGSNDYMLRGGDLTSNTDGKTGILSFWVKRGNLGAQQMVIETDNGSNYLVEMQFNSDNTFHARARNAALSQILFLKTNTTIADTNWHHVLAAWDLAAGAGYMYVDDVANLDSGSKVVTNDTIDYTVSEHSFGADHNGSSKCTADFADVYVNYDEYLDISSAANRRKFISAAGKPVYLGSDGSLPTGASPEILFSLGSGDAASTFATNDGTGGNYSITGSLALASTSPS